MTIPGPCPRGRKDHSELPFVRGVTVGCLTCQSAGLSPHDYIIRGRGWRCRACRESRIAPETWAHHELSEGHQVSVAQLERRASLQAQLSSLLSDIGKARNELGQIRAVTAAELDRREAEARAQISARTQSVRAELAQVEEQLGYAREDLAHERAELLEVRAKAAEVSGFADAEAKARAAAEAEQRRVAETERAKAEAEERRAGEVDRRLLAGEDPQGIADSVGCTTEAQVRARMVALAKLRESRGQPWAELALDQEIARLLSLGTKRDAIRDQLGVGEHRIAGVRRRHRTGTGSAP